MGWPKKARPEYSDSDLTNNGTNTASRSHTHSPASRLSVSSTTHMDTCPTCGLRTGQMWLHARERHATLAFECDLCGLRMQTHSGIRRHIKLKHQNAGHQRPKLHQCDLCGRTYQTAGGLRTHQFLHTGQRPHRCELCTKAYSTVASLRLHQRIHAGATTHPCDVCAKGFYDSSTLRVHQLQHSGESPYVCHLCGKRTKQVSNMKSHYRHFHKITDISGITIRANSRQDDTSQSDEPRKWMSTVKPEPTDEYVVVKKRQPIEPPTSLCSVKPEPSDEYVVETNQSVVHLEQLEFCLNEEYLEDPDDDDSVGKPENTEPLTDDDDDYGNANYILVDVTDRARDDESDPLQTSELDVVVPAETEPICEATPLSDHCWATTPDDRQTPAAATSKTAATAVPSERRLSSAICEQCGRQFATGGQMRRHQTMHSELRQYACDACPARFKARATLRAHQRLHGDEWPFVCQWCGRRFRHNYTQLQHERTHTGERPFVCDECGSRFADPSTLRQHRLVHTGERPYRCHLCGKGCTQAGNLKSHLRHFHKIETRSLGVRELGGLREPMAEPTVQRLEVQIVDE